MVEKVDGRRIDRFCREEIFDPLDIPDTRFEVEPHMAARLALAMVRQRLDDRHRIYTWLSYRHGKSCELAKPVAACHS